MADKDRAFFLGMGILQGAGWRGAVASGFLPDWVWWLIYVAGFGFMVYGMVGRKNRC